MIPDLVTNYLEKHELSYRQMADEINKQLGSPNAVTYQSISNWVHGEHDPHPLKIEMLAKHGHGDLKVLAQEILKVLQEPAMQS